VDIVCSLLAAVLFAAIAYGTGAHAVEAYRGKEFLPGVVMWPVWLSYLPIPIGAAMLVLRLLHHCVTLARQGEDPFVAAEGEGAVE
jgi:TRAP-type C4-dicarboxylate transport system permease small subunit